MHDWIAKRIMTAKSEVPTRPTRDLCVLPRAGEQEYQHFVVAIVRNNFKDKLVTHCPIVAAFGYISYVPYIYYMYLYQYWVAAIMMRAHCPISRSSMKRSFRFGKLPSNASDYNFIYTLTGSHVFTYIPISIVSNGIRSMCSRPPIV